LAAALETAIDNHIPPLYNWLGLIIHVAIHAASSRVQLDPGRPIEIMFLKEQVINMSASKEDIELEIKLLTSMEMPVEEI